jgi:DNA-binding transcriptional MerR regulator
MTPAAGRRPAEVSRELGVSPSTLRRWSQQFGDILSPEAGNLISQPSGKTAHRRYASTDVETLQRVRQLMQQGLTVDEVRTRLAVDFVPAPASEPDPDVEDPAAELVSTDSHALVFGPEPEDAPDIGQLVSDTLSSLSDSQKIILGGQQTSRQLLGVLLQDNFNIKEENVRLRERMVDTERRVFEMKRELDGNRSAERERMRQMEAHLFDLQRRLDAIAQQRAVVQQPPMPQPVPVPVAMPTPVAEPLSPPVAVAPVELSEQPPVDAAMTVEPEPEVGTATESELAPEAPAPEPEQAVAKKQGFWAWLWGK